MKFSMGWCVLGLVVGCAGEPEETDEPVDTDPVDTDSVDTDPVDTDPVDTDPAENPDGALEARVYYGECIGYCITTVTFLTDGEVELLAEGWNEEGNDLEPTTATGTLSDAAASDWETLLAEVNSLTLDEVYGCPDCDDGGGVSVLRENMTPTDYPAGDPPDVLADFDAFLWPVRAALTDCVSSEEISVAEGCAPLWDN